MTSIPQKIKIEAENILKDVTKNVILENINDLSNLFLSSRLSSIFLISKLKQIVLQIYQRAITLIDKMFLNSEYRKKYYYKSTSTPQKRTIINVFGELYFKRHYYVDKNKKNGFYFIDEFFHFEEYSTYDYTVRSILIDRSVSNNVNNTSANYHLNLLLLQIIFLDKPSIVGFINGIFQR